MTLKSSYLAKWKENVRRRGWTFLLCAVALDILVPLICLMTMLNRQKDLLEFAVGTQEYLKRFELMKTSFESFVGFSGTDAILAVFFAVVFGLQGFSWLYKQQKMDLYMSVPVSKTKRFILIWLNGVFAYAVCYLIGQLLCYGVGAFFGLLEPYMLVQFFLNFGLQLLLFIANYQLVLLAVMLCGNTGCALLGTGVLFIYEWLIRYLLERYMNWFVSYCGRILEGFWVTPFVSWLKVRESNRMLWDTVGKQGSLAAILTMLGEEAIFLLGFSLVVGALVYWLFRIRRTEAHGWAIAFPAIKPVLEVLLLIPFAMLVGLLGLELSGDSSVMLFVCALLAVLLGHGIIQLIYERDLRAVKKQKTALLFSLAVSCLLIALFRFDWIGYDSYVPKPEKVERVSVAMERDYTPFRRFDMDALLSMDLDEYILEHMSSEDPDTIAAVLEMANAWQSAGRPEDSTVWSTAWPLQLPGEKDGDNSLTAWWIARYELSGGRTVYRRFLVNPTVTPEAVLAVTRDDTWRRARYQIYDEQFANCLPSMRIRYHDGMLYTLYTGDKEEFYRAYLEDFAAYDLELIQNNLPCGVLDFYFGPEEDGQRECVLSFPVYECFTRTRALLSADGIANGLEDGLLPTEDVSEIRVRYRYDPEAEEDLLAVPQTQIANRNIEPTWLIASFDRPDQIAQILQSVYPDRLNTMLEDGLCGWRFERSVQVDEVKFSESGKEKRYATSGVTFREGRIPDFVLDALRESLQKELENSSAHE